MTIQGQEIVLYDGIHGTGQPHFGKISLRKGRVPIRVDYFQGPTGAKDLIIKWSGPEVQQRLLSVPFEEGLRASEGKNRKKDFKNLITSKGPGILGTEVYGQYTKSLQQLDELKRNKVNAPSALCVTELGPNPPETFLLKRGNPQSQGDVMVPAYLSPLGGGLANIPKPDSSAITSGRRLALANWIASPSNWLTARVMVNRLWQHHLGRGIVRSPNNFGLLGDRPTHPELLDWLAIEFMQGSNPTNGQGLIPGDAWTMKRIHKLIVTSSTYRMSSSAPIQNSATKTTTSSDKNPLLVDPLNHLFWRHDMRRLGAEEVRDSVLAVSGHLSSKMYGPGVYPKISDEVKAGQSNPGAGWGNSTIEDQSRRSIYVHVKRSLVLPILSDFDVADTDSSCAARFTTTQPTQALGMLNGEFLNEQATQFAKRLRAEAGADVKRQIWLAYRLALNREPDQDMIQRGLSLIEALKTKHELSADIALEKFCLMALNLNEFVYLD